MSAIVVPDLPWCFRVNFSLPYSRAVLDKIQSFIVLKQTVLFFFLLNLKLKRVCDISNA